MQRISKRALEVIHRLTKAGYDAYLVGGCIRDLLIGASPKDFDIATNAMPEQVRQLFKNARIIGRRFKLVHVFWGQEIIEVATFRGHHTEDKTTGFAKQDNRGRILVDNVYGTIEEDAFRRDFSINALYFDINNKNIVDYTQGMDDLDQKVIRVIGNPIRRYQEDPVRMLRAIRFNAKLGFTLEPKTDNAVYASAGLLSDIPAARLFDEVNKLFLSGYAVKTYEKLCQYGLFAHLFPKVDPLVKQNTLVDLFIKQALLNTDSRLAEGKTVNPAFLYAALLWPVVIDALPQPFSKEVPSLPALRAISEKVLADQCQHTSIPRRLTIMTHEIWEAQVKLTRRQGKRADILLAQPRFRAGYDFLLLRESVGAEMGELGQWWANYQIADDQARRLMISQLVPASENKRSRYKHRSSKAKKDIKA